MLNIKSKLLSKFQAAIGVTGDHLQNAADKNRKEKELVDTITDTKTCV